MHDRPRKGQKTAYKPCTKTEKRVNEWKIYERAGISGKRARNAQSNNKHF